MGHVTLDARRLLCPLPVIKTQNKVQHMQSGDQLTIICTDPGALHDIPCWCRMYGHRVVATEQTDQEITIVVEVGVID